MGPYPTGIVATTVVPEITLTLPGVNIQAELQFEFVT